jgi:hypothetical protein
VKCSGRGADGDHCCWINGDVCQFLNVETVRCTIWDDIGGSVWQTAPVGGVYARRYPGFTCHDWPQNIPEVMNAAKGLGPYALCCWSK